MPFELYVLRTWIRNRDIIQPDFLIYKKKGVSQWFANIIKFVEFLSIRMAARNKNNEKKVTNR